MQDKRQENRRDNRPENWKEGVAGSHDVEGRPYSGEIMSSIT